MLQKEVYKNMHKKKKKNQSSEHIVEASKQIDKNGRQNRLKGIKRN